MMIENKNIFALLIGAGNYEKMNTANLPTYKLDLAVLSSALMAGLKIPQANIRLVAGTDYNGYVTANNLAMAFADFKSKLGNGDTFIFYFSGHGRDKNIALSDGQIELQSIIDCIEKLPAKNKIVILDCCYSGDFKTTGTGTMHLEDSMEEFAGHGIAVMASSAANEVARLGPNGRCSMFTGALSTAILSNKHRKNGKISLEEINDEANRLVNAWNLRNPGKEQHPVFRSSMGGTIFFRIADDQPDGRFHLSFETDDYVVENVEPMNSKKEKRLRAFIRLKKRKTSGELSSIVLEIAEHIKQVVIDSDHSNEQMLNSQTLNGRGGNGRTGNNQTLNIQTVNNQALNIQALSGIWCYFGNDADDMANHNFHSYAIWSEEEDIKKKYFKTNGKTAICSNVYLCENTSYNLVKSIQTRTQTREEFIEVNKSLLIAIVNKAESFISDFQEVKNNVITLEEMQRKYGSWVKEIRQLYTRLSNGDIPPNDLKEWSDEIMDLAGWILDCSLLFETKKNGETVGEREKWLINQAIHRYNESMEKIKLLEKMER